MMGRLNRDQGQLFYSFCLDEAVPDEQRVRDIAAVLDLSWVHAELAPHYSHLGRPSIDPVLMIGMLIVGLRVRHPLGTAAVPRGASEPGAPLVLRLEHRGQDFNPVSPLLIATDGSELAGRAVAHALCR